jgi:hypothetical protein
MGRNGNENLLINLSFQVQINKWIGIIEDLLENSQPRGHLIKKINYVN